MLLKSGGKTGQKERRLKVLSAHYEWRSKGRQLAAGVALFPGDPAGCQLLFSVENGLLGMGERARNLTHKKESIYARGGSYLWS